MPVMTWKDEYSVGIKTIDDEHKRLVSMINMAYDAGTHEKRTGELKQLVGEMLQYTMTHFSNEEELMSKYGYPDSTAHTDEHDNFMAEAGGASNSLGSDDHNLDVQQMFEFLTEWLQSHILDTDMKFGHFLNEKGME